jgi:hypothetical protein
MGFDLGALSARPRRPPREPTPLPAIPSVRTVIDRMELRTETLPPTFENAHSYLPSSRAAASGGVAIQGSPPA